MFKLPSAHPQPREFHGPVGSPHSVWQARPLPAYRADTFKRSAVDSARTGAEKPNQINGLVSADFDPRSAPPLNLLGGGSHHFTGALTQGRCRLLAAVIDAELGVPSGEPIISADGGVSFRIPTRRAR